MMTCIERSLHMSMGILFHLMQEVGTPEMSEQIGIVRIVYVELSEVTPLEHLRHSPETFTVKPVETLFSLRNASKLYLM